MNGEAASQPAEEVRTDSAASAGPRALDLLPVKNGFRMRGTRLTRLETFMDAAFAFATTMLVISVGEIPGDYGQLMEAMKRVPSFLCSFVVIMLFWLGHRTWSRRYGLEDGKTILISIALIFVLLVYVYPLRLMFSALFGWVSGGWLPSRYTPGGPGEITGLFAVYGFGLFAMAGLMSLLYARARMAAESLMLNAREELSTSLEVFAWCTVSLTGLSSALLSLLLPGRFALLAGFVYMVLPVVLPLVDARFSRRIRSLAGSAPSEELHREDGD
jgi:uncharacterized membrane protein